MAANRRDVVAYGRAVRCRYHHAARVRQSCTLYCSCLDRYGIASRMDAVGGGMDWDDPNRGRHDHEESSHAWLATMDAIREPGIYDYHALDLGLVRLETTRGRNCAANGQRQSGGEGP